MNATESRIPRIDRRLDARQDSLAGLTRWLESARKTLKVEALALADAAGCLVVGAGSARKCEELAAVAPLVNTLAGNAEVTASSLCSGAAWLCAPSGSWSSEAWQTATCGCLRILGLQS